MLCAELFVTDVYHRETLYVGPGAVNLKSFVGLELIV